jgi:hypothetical protein
MFFEVLAFGHVPTVAADESPAAEGETDSAYATTETLIATGFDRLAAGTVH